MSTNSKSAESLCIAFDVGTTSSTVSILHKCGSSTKPSIRTVTSWPASPNDMKVPSVLAYDFSGNVIACGAEALLADRNKCTLVEHFKLHLHPADIKVDSSAAPVLSATSIPTEPIRDFERTKLPSGVKIVDVYSTFIKYLYQNAKAWFEANTLSGEKIWENSTISLIFAMPDGHGEFEFAIIRNAFVTAGICSSIHDQRLEFIREAEAVVHFALESVDWLQPGVCFTVVDVGGSTTDCCFYTVVQTTPKLELKEVKTSDCVQVGGVLVDQHAALFLRSKLANSNKYNGEDNMNELVKIFESRTKRIFDGASSSILKFGNSKDNDSTVNIQAGRLVLTAQEVRSIFQDSIDEIVASISSQIRFGKTRSTHIVLSGGMGDSKYLLRVLKENFPSQVIVVSGEPSKQAVSAGACHWFNQNTVSARAVRQSYGLKCGMAGLPANDLRYAGMARYQNVDGLYYTQGCWSSIVKKGTILKSESSWEEHYTKMSSNKASLYTDEADLLLYRGDDSIDSPAVCVGLNGTLLEDFGVQCVVRSNLSALVECPQPFVKNTYNTVANQAQIRSGQVFWRIHFRVCVFFAGHSLKAKVKWVENGCQRESDAQIIVQHSVDRKEDNQVRKRAPALIRAENGW